MERFQIIFPPQFEPFQPYLSGPYLKALLGHFGENALVFDANIDFYDWLLLFATEPIPWSQKYSKSTSYLREQIRKAINIIRSNPDSISDYRWGINVVDQYLRNVSPPKVEIGLTYLKVGNRYSSQDLLTFLESPDNIFRFYFDYASERLLGDTEISIYLFSLVVIDQLPAAITFTQEIKKRRPYARVIVGGPLVSQFHRQLCAIPWIAEVFDTIAPGEAYRTIPMILNHQDHYLGHITPDFSDLDLDKYWSSQRVVPYLVAHGCKWSRCVFCSHHATYERYRTSSIQETLLDIKEFTTRWKIDYISFSDEYLSSEQLLQLSLGILDHNLGIKWSTFARPEPSFANPRFTCRLYNAGCRMLMFGLESASQHVLNSMKKGTNVNHFRLILDACKEANIAVRCDFMIGFPGEDDVEIQQTFKFIDDNRDVLDTPFSTFSIAVFELRNNSPIIEDCKKYGILPKGSLRGDLDDQVAFDVEGGIHEDALVEYRERMIRLFKMEYDAEMICPGNKTHQLILKSLFDHELLNLPDVSISPDRFLFLTTSLAPGVKIAEEDSSVLLVNHANGGMLELDKRLFQLFKLLATDAVTIEQAFLNQRLWNRSAFTKLINFLFRNDYITLCNTPYKEN